MLIKDKDPGIPEFNGIASNCCSGRVLDSRSVTSVDTPELLYHSSVCVGNLPQTVDPIRFDAPLTMSNARYTDDVHQNNAFNFGLDQGMTNFLGFTSVPEIDHTTSSLPISGVDFNTTGSTCIYSYITLF